MPRRFPYRKREKKSADWEFQVIDTGEAGGLSSSAEEESSPASASPQLETHNTKRLGNHENPL
jgi:hypothetical protein